MNRKLLVLLACVGFAAAACVTPSGGGGGPTPNVAPIAAIVATPTAGLAYLSTEFSAAGSVDDDGTIVDYAWDFGDGHSSSSASVDAQNLYTAAGGYLVTLTVTDDDGDTGSTTQIITVSDDPDGRYVAADGVDAPGCQLSNAPCATVTYAVGQADASGDTVYVDSGTYPEMVYVAKDVSFKGPNLGKSAGAHPDARRPEATLKGIRTGTLASKPGNVQRSIQIDGLAFDAQGDALYLPGQNTSLVWLYGGPNNLIQNSVFTGGAFAASCGSTCLTNTDRAIEIRTGEAQIINNSISNFKRATSFYQTGATGTLITLAYFAGNKVTGFTSQGLQIAPAGGNPSMPGVTVEDNIFDATGIDYPTSAPASVIATTGTNLIRNNNFIGGSSAIYLYTCVSNYVTGPQTIINNQFDGNRTGVAVAVDTPANCAIHNVNGSVIENNNFNTGAGAIKNGVSVSASYFTGGAGPLDVSCNWWGVATGPNTGGLDAPVNPSLTTSPWLDAPAPGGGCTGS